jgi:hypothetical protein
MKPIVNPFYANRFKRVAPLPEAHHRPVVSDLDSRRGPPHPRRFSLGEVVYSGNATLRLRTEEVLTALRRHAEGDWGDLLPEDAIANELALEHGGRLFSAYGFGHDRFWVITDFELSLTAILLPDD